MPPLYEKRCSWKRDRSGARQGTRSQGPLPLMKCCPWRRDSSLNGGIFLLGVGVGVGVDPSPHPMQSTRAREMGVRCGGVLCTVGCVFFVDEGID